MVVCCPQVTMNDALCEVSAVYIFYINWDALFDISKHKNVIGSHFHNFLYMMLLKWLLLYIAAINNIHVTL